MPQRSSIPDGKSGHSPLFFRQLFSLKNSEGYNSKETMLKFKNILARCVQRKLVVLAAAATTIGAMGMPAANAAYPEHPINMVVSYGPGGGTDLVARATAPHIEKYLRNEPRIWVFNPPAHGRAKN